MENKKMTTDCFVRFSTVAGERGVADAERDLFDSIEKGDFHRLDEALQSTR